MAWTTSDFDAAVRRRARIPDGDSAFSAAEIRAIGDEETLTLVAPLVRKVKQDHWTTHFDQSITEGTFLYQLPTRTLGGTFRDIVHVDGNGNEAPIQPISLQSMPRFKNDATSKPLFYALEGDALRLTSDEGTTLRVKYQRRPARLCATTAAAEIVDPDPGTTGRCTVADTSVVDLSDGIDIVHARPQFGLPVQDKSAVVVNATTFSVFDASLVAVDLVAAGVLIGDWLCPIDQTPIPQVPDVCHPVLIAATVVRVLESLGNAQMLPAAQAKLEEAVRAVEALIVERDEGASPKWIARTSPLRGGRRGLGRG